MPDNAPQLFNIQRFQILSQFVSESTGRSIPPAYAFAWHELVYPILHGSAPWHQGYGHCFDASEEDTIELLHFLADLRDKGDTITFWDLETHYGVRGNAVDGDVWNRHTLLSACQYFRLGQRFGDAFWDVMTENGKSPMEAKSIDGKFEIHNVYFL